MAPGNPHSVCNLVSRNINHLGKFVIGRLAFVLLLEFLERLVDLVQGTHLVQRQTHDAGLLCKGLKNGLAYPPDCIGDEFESPRFVKLFGSLDESEIALIDEVWKAKSLVLILFCH